MPLNKSLDHPQRERGNHAFVTLDYSQHRLNITDGFAWVRMLDILRCKRRVELSELLALTLYRNFMSAAAILTQTERRTGSKPRMRVVFSR